MIKEIKLDNDFEKYIEINQEIQSGNFDKAWNILSQIESLNLRNSYIQSAFEASDIIENKIKKYRVSEECDGTHIRDEYGEGSSGSGGGSNGGGGSVIGGIIALIICTICCSKSYDGCCWCVWYDAICSFIEWCPCR